MSSLVDHTPKRDKAGVLIPWFNSSDPPSDSREAETEGLVLALGCELGFLTSPRIRKKNPSHLISAGVLEDFSKRLDDAECTMAIIDTNLSPIQQRNLEKTLNRKVIDRTGLILEIFGLRARTREGVLQVEMARLNYERSRLVRTWTHLERQRGGRGFLGGPGETQLESDKRMLDRALKNLQRDLEGVQKTRALQRAGRRRQGIPVVALVGYTNAGKSTLFNRLSGADVFAKDMPFATLDPTIRHVELPSIGEIALVDTVGFISELPTHLIDSFKATLEEVLEADLLIHVRDRTSESDIDNYRDVLSILKQLEESAGGELPPMIEAWNKSDLLTLEHLQSLKASTQSADETSVLVSAIGGNGVDRLLSAIELCLRPQRRSITVLLQSSAGRARAWLHENATVIEEISCDEGLSLNVEMDAETEARWAAEFRAEELNPL